MKKSFVTLFLSFFSILLSAFDLVKDGESLVYIHLPENAGPVKTFAASELSAWIKAMTGASVPVSAGKRPGLLPVSYHLADEAGLAMNPDVKNAAESLKNQGFLLDAGPRGLRIIADDPDYIFVVFQGSDQDAAQKTLDVALTSNPAWDTLSAVQNGNFYLMEKDLYHLKPNARWGEAYQKVADILYPAA